MKFTSIGARGLSLLIAVAMATTVAVVVAQGLAAPGAPTDLTATVEGKHSIRLSWTASTSEVTQYNVERSADGETGWARLGSVGGTTTSFEHTGLEPGTSNHYRVTASNGHGDSAPTNTVAATTAFNPPGVPRNLAATAGGTTVINLSWDAPEAHRTKAQPTGYRILWSPNPPDGTWRFLTEVATIGYADTGLAATDTYHYTVLALSASGNSTYSGLASATTSAGGDAPQNLTAAANGENGISISWAAPDIGSSQRTISSYRVDWSPDGAPRSWKTLAARHTATRYDDTGLKAGTTRHYRVYAVFNDGRGAPSNTADAKTAQPTAPTAPTGLTATASGNDRITLEWNAPANGDNAASVTGYRIEWSSNGQGDSWQTLVANQGANSYVDTGIIGGETYHYRVFALSDSGDSPASDAAVATAGGANSGRVAGKDGNNGNTGEASGNAVDNNGSATQVDPEQTPEPAAAPLAPTGLSASSQGTNSNSISLSWSAPAGSSDRASVTGYRLESRGESASSGWSTVTNVGAGVTSYTHSGLPANTTYYYRVIATSSAGDSPASGALRAATDPAPPPQGPPNSPGLRAQYAGSNSASITWDAPAPGDNRAPVTGYRLERSTDRASTWTTLATLTGTSYTDSGLSLDSAYYYRVFATSSAGDSPESNWDVVNTPRQ